MLVTAELTASASTKSKHLQRRKLSLRGVVAPRKLGLERQNLRAFSCAGNWAGHDFWRGSPLHGCEPHLFGQEDKRMGILRRIDEHRRQDQALRSREARPRNRR